MIDIPLHDVPSAAWQASFDKAASTPYMRKKYNRERRLKDKAEYIKSHCPSVVHGLSGMIVDIGPGPGEFLELCRHYGNAVMGIEAPDGDGGMGDDYWTLSTLMHQRQQLAMSYGGWQTIVGGDYPGEKTVALFNSQGSWSQAYSDFLDGEPHHVSHDATAQQWRFGPELSVAWCEAFCWMRSRLIPGGVVLIYDNVTGPERDQIVYQRLMARCAEMAGLNQLWRKSPVLACWGRG